MRHCSGIGIAKIMTDKSTASDVKVHSHRHADSLVHEAKVCVTQSRHHCSASLQMSGLK